MTETRSWTDRVRQRRMRSYWTRHLKAGNVSDALRKDARKLRRILDEIEYSANGPQDPGDLYDGLPTTTQWATRPAPWATPIKTTATATVASGTQIAEGTSLYHDANMADVLLRQSHAQTANAAPFQLSVEVADFDGGYVSLAIGLPASEIANVERSDLIRLDLSYSSDHPVNVLARTNIKIGPNTEQITREVDPTRVKPVVEFDLFYADLETLEITDVWVDIIFEKPVMNLITLHDVRLSRRPRANF